MSVRDRQGFKLIELLVVIAIIAINFAAQLLPANPGCPQNTTVQSTKAARRK
jgi:prepilin-type N-terminal cleavage/methylation domain-containing protein